MGRPAFSYVDNPIGHGWQAAPEDVYGPPPTPQLSRLLSGGYVSAYYLWLLLCKTRDSCRYPGCILPRTPRQSLVRTGPLNLSPDYSHASLPLLEGLVSLPPPPRLRLRFMAPERIWMRC